MLRSVPRLFMLVVSTATFALGLIALVLETSLAFQQFAHELGSSSGSLWSPRRTNVIAAVCTTITYFVVSISSRPPPNRDRAAFVHLLTFKKNNLLHT